MGRHRKPLTGFDLETAGTDPHEARVATGAVAGVLTSCGRTGTQAVALAGAGVVR
ncbi:hypothetical protein [Streptomyces sp. NBC_00820]|uniref:hypothetical protein n=1 Tax=Streptomyces sp. NBC_00820 TaxID=2975842 RepID=UPI003FA6EC78